MKSLLRILSLISACGFALATVIQTAGIFAIPGVHAAALVGGLAGSCLFALMLGDYARKPAFRVRRASSAPGDAGPTVNRPAGPGPDWTYATRIK
jgi:hypothetical protein